MQIILYCFFVFTMFSYSQTINGVITFNPIKAIGDDTVLSEKSKKPRHYSYIFSNKISEQKLISNEGTTIEHIFLDENTPFETEIINITPSNTIFYKNYNKNIFRLESTKKNENLIDEHTSIKDVIPIYDWALENESQTIIGHLCKKATTKKNIGSRIQQITAWYAEDILIDDGPMDFNGLPGLILKIEIDDTSIVKFEKLEFFSSKTTEIEVPAYKTNTITLSEYYKNY
ncbi:MAG: GLPGLI family protein [Flavobacteriaceae bacterium]